jgi:tetratricopeptide (TPR) repeat protein
LSTVLVHKNVMAAAFRAHKAAERMYLQVLAGKEKALGPDHTSTLETVHNLGTLYRDQGKLAEAEQMYQRALAGYENVTRCPIGRAKPEAVTHRQRFYK